MTWRPKVKLFNLEFHQQYLIKKRVNWFVPPSLCTFFARKKNRKVFEFTFSSPPPQFTTQLIGKKDFRTTKPLDWSCRNNLWIFPLFTTTTIQTIYSIFNILRYSITIQSLYHIIIHFSASLGISVAYWIILFYTKQLFMLFFQALL
jgi:hypothetical protein